MSDQAGLIVASLKALVTGDGEAQIGLWGGAASGKTHLLNASAEFARRNGVLLQIYDAVQLQHCAASEFDGHSDCDVLVIDNLDAIAGNPEWEVFFYRAINRCRDGDYRFLFALTDKPDDLQTRLNDFRSRLQWGLMLQLPPIGDAEIRDILRQRAGLLGIELSVEVIAYLMSRFPRNLSAQMDILQQLDRISLSHQRKVTIPLVKSALLEQVE